MKSTEAQVPGWEAQEALVVGAGGGGHPIACEQTWDSATSGREMQKILPQAQALWAQRWHHHVPRAGSEEEGAQEQLLPHATGLTLSSVFTRAVELRSSVPGPRGHLQDRSCATSPLSACKCVRPPQEKAANEVTVNSDSHVCRNSCKRKRRYSMVLKSSLLPFSYSGGTGGRPAPSSPSLHFLGP